MTSYVWESWQRCERELTRQRGLWGPMKGSHLDKWMLDATEGPCRMRKKMVQNRHFYKHYPYKPQTENLENVSFDSLHLLFLSIFLFLLLLNYLSLMARDNRLFISAQATFRPNFNWTYPNTMNGSGDTC